VFQQDYSTSGARWQPVAGNFRARFSCEVDKHRRLFLRFENFLILALGAL
jgi:hypothetical protein